MLEIQQLGEAVDGQEKGGAAEPEEQQAEVKRIVFQR